MLSCGFSTVILINFYFETLLAFEKPRGCPCYKVLRETTSGEGETSQGFPILNIGSIDETIVCSERPLGFKHMVAKIVRFVLQKTTCGEEESPQGFLSGKFHSAALSLSFSLKRLLPLQHFIITATPH